MSFYRCHFRLGLSSRPKTKQSLLLSLRIKIAWHPKYLDLFNPYTTASFLILPRTRQTYRYLVCALLDKKIKNRSCPNAMWNTLKWLWYQQRWYFDIRYALVRIIINMYVLCMHRYVAVQFGDFFSFFFQMFWFFSAAETVWQILPFILTIQSSTYEIGL